MKPQFIFGAVISICLAMVALLPQLGHATLPAVDPKVAAAEALPVVESHSAEEIQPELATLPVATMAAEPTTADVPVEATPEIGTLEVAAEDVIAIPGQDQTQADQPEPAAQAAPPAAAAPASVSDAGLTDFSASLAGSRPGEIIGVYAPGVLGLPVTGQPGGDDNYVSPDDNVLTLYGKPAEYGVVALLAHNYLNSGRSFYNLKKGQEIYVVFGDKRTVTYRVTTIAFYQALDSTNVRSDFRDLNGPGGAILTYDQLFNHIYAHSNRLVFQTCLEANGDLSWGRLFVTAEPVS